MANYSMYLVFRKTIFFLLWIFRTTYITSTRNYRLLINFKEIWKNNVLIVLFTIRKWMKYDNEVMCICNVTLNQVFFLMYITLIALITLWIARCNIYSTVAQHIHFRLEYILPPSCVCLYYEFLVNIIDMQQYNLILTSYM